MEEENKQEVPETKENVTNETTTAAPAKFDLKKCGIFAGIGVAVIAVIVVLISLFSGGPKKAVKKYVKAFNSRNAKKLMECVDLAGMQAAGWGIDPDNFTSEDYKEFKENYDKIDKEELNATKDLMLKSLEGVFDELKEKAASYKVSVKKFKEIKKLGKDLYAVDCDMHIKAVPKDKENNETIDEDTEATFIVYKNKVIDPGSLF